MSRSWKFFTVIEHEWGLGESEYRFFSGEIAARAYIEKEHDRRWDYEKDDMKLKEGFEDAAVYRILSNGQCKLVQKYSTIADGSGFGIGWVEEVSTHADKGLHHQNHQHS